MGWTSIQLMTELGPSSSLMLGFRASQLVYSGSDSKTVHSHISTANLPRFHPILERNSWHRSTLNCKSMHQDTGSPCWHAMGYPACMFSPGLCTEAVPTCASSSTQGAWIAHACFKNRGKLMSNITGWIAPQLSSEFEGNQENWQKVSLLWPTVWVGKVQ